jgi:hypothetical protein
MSEPRHPRDEARFDEELERIARDLASEPLPHGILDVVRPGRSTGFDGVRTRRSMPGFAAAAGALLVLVLATTAVVAPGFLTLPQASRPPVDRTGPPKPTAPPALRLSGAIRGDLEALEWACRTGDKLESVAPGPDAMVQEAAICLAPDEGPYLAAATIGTSRTNQVVQLMVKASIVGRDTPESRQAAAAAIGEATTFAIVNYGNQMVTKYWLANRMALMDPGSTNRLDLNGFTVYLERLSPSGTYVMRLELQVPNT